MGLLAGDLDDACQEVFIQVFRYLARFEQRADFQTWLYKLCLSQANRVRRRRRMRESLLRLFGRDTLPRQAAAESEWSEAVAIQRVQQAMCKMRPMHKEVFVLFEFENVDGDGIARILGCPPATVRRRLHYARVEFESLLRAEDAEDGKP
jgi:RNA polymerase sigma-70 factor (ECF subfamily)